MALRPRRRLRSPGLPEFVAAFLLVMAGIPAALWLHSVHQPDWEQTTGQVVSCTIRSTHYNAQPNRAKLDLVYDYHANGIPYREHWTGMWPHGEGPNALPIGRLDELKQAGYPLTVLYDPQNPSSSRLHETGKDRQLYYGILAPVMLVLALAYCLKGYPAWRRAWE